MQSRPSSYKASLSPSSSMSPAEGPVPSSSTSSSRNSKLDHIIQNFYTKTAQSIIQARCASKGRGKLNKWFNIATEDSDAVREQVRYWRNMAIQADLTAPQPMTIDIYLDTAKLHSTQALMVVDDNMRRNRVDLGAATDGIQRIMLETWTLSLTHPLPDFAVDLPSLYKRSIVFFRSLHSMVRLLPCYHLYRRLSKQPTTDLHLGYQVRSYAVRRHDEIPLEGTILEGDARLPIKTYTFSDIVTPLGTFKLQVQYRRNCEFQVEDVERDFSTRFVDMDEYYFTPTVAKYDGPRSARPVSMYGGTSTSPTKAVPTSSTSTSSRVSYHGGESSLRRTRASPVSSSSPKKSSISALEPVISTSTSSVTRGGTSIPAISPFKSPSLSSSPQADQLFGGRTQSPIEKPKSNDSHSSSFGRKIEFSSSFENRFMQVDFEDTDLEEFVRFVGKQHELKLFQQPGRVAQIDTALERASSSSSPSPAGPHGSMPGSPTFTSGTNSIYRSKKALSHFQMLRDTHNNLSDSMTASMFALGLQASPPASSSSPQQAQQQQQAQPQPSTSSPHHEGMSPSSSSSSTTASRSYQPTIPSPLHHHHVPAVTSAAATTTTMSPSASMEQQRPLQMQQQPQNRHKSTLGSASTSLPTRHTANMASPPSTVGYSMHAMAVNNASNVSASPPIAIASSSRRAMLHPSSSSSPPRASPSSSSRTPQAPHPSTTSPTRPVPMMLGAATTTKAAALPRSASPPSSTAATTRSILATTTMSTPSASTATMAGTTTTTGGSRLLPSSSHLQQHISSSSSGGGGTTQQSGVGVGGRTSMMEDDDSLVFKMSELGMEPSTPSIHDATNTPSPGQIFKTRRMVVNALRRTSSSDNIRATDDNNDNENDRHSPSASSIKSEPTNFDPEQPWPSFGGW
ncbi:autophagy-related protein 13-domain-containing protein [Gongronella butleri]|nr:autophagy-related protein 13-domain-containing protein [Gongronella butleri]